MNAMRSIFPGIRGFVILVLHLFLLNGCVTRQDGVEGGPVSDTSAADSQFRNLTESVEFVGDAACFQCHEDQYTGFQDHGMAHSFYELTPESAVEEFGSQTIVDSTSGYRYRTFEENGAYYMEEFLLDAEGQETHSLVRKMEYVVGSGTIARTYITEENGWFYQLPVTWYTNANRWDFSPGYEEGNSRFDRKIADRCMTCHNSYPDPVAQTNGAYDSVPFGIGCERCHGAGAVHVEERLISQEPSEEMDATIVNPAHLDVDRQLDVCQQCHLSADVSILREGRTAYDFRPSQRLDAYIALFSTHKEEVAGSVEVISHADRMKRSACFIETLNTPEPLLCTTCHDPHEGFRDQGDAYFNATCMDCHGAADLEARFEGTPALTTHSVTANCVDCHMPEADVEEAPHSTFTDHWIRVVGRDDALQPIRSQGTGTLAPYYERDTNSREGKMYQGMATITLGRQEGDEELLREGIALIDEAAREARVSDEALFLQGFALQLLGDYDRSVEPLEEAVRADPSVAERLNALAQSYEQLGVKSDVTGQLYEQALSIQPKLADIHINYGRFLESQGDMTLAMAQYRRAAAEEPFNMLARYNLGTAYIRAGNDAEAEAWLRQALSLDPRYVPAISNLGLVHAMRGESEAARELFEQGVSIDPESYEALDNLGTFHLNEDNERQAVEYLGRAYAARPAASATSSKYALALFRAGDFAAARTQALRTLELTPDDETSRQILSALE